MMRRSRMMTNGFHGACGGPQQQQQQQRQGQESRRRWCSVNRKIIPQQSFICLLSVILVHLLLMMTVPTTATFMFSIHPYEEECFMLRTPAFADGRTRLFSGTFSVLDDDQGGGGERERQDAENGNDKGIKRNEPISMVVMDATDPKKFKNVFHTNKHPKAASTVFRVPVGSGDGPKKYLVCLRNNIANKNINAAEARRRMREDAAEEQEEESSADTDASADAERNKIKYEGKVYDVGFSHRLVALGMVRQKKYDSAAGNNTTTNSTVDPGEDVHAQMTASWTTQATLLEDVMTHLKDHQDYMRTREINHRNMAEKTFTDTLTWTLVEVTALCIIAVTQVLYIRRYLEKKRYGM